jgi:hypothetical protein
MASLHNTINSLPSGTDDLLNRLANINQLNNWINYFATTYPSDSQRELHNQLSEFLNNFVYHSIFSIDFYLPGLNVTDDMRNSFIIETGGIGHGPRRQILLQQLAERIFYNGS